MAKTILHIAEAPGGVDRYIELLVSNFDKSYKHILVVSKLYNVSKYEVMSNVERVIQVDIKHDLGMSDFKTIREIRKIIKETQPDVVYCHSTKAGFVGRLANRCKKIPLIYNAHGWCFDMNISKLKRFIYVCMEKFLAFKTTKIVCISNHEKQSALKRKICKENKLQLIYNGVDYAEIDAVKNNKEITKEKLNIPVGPKVVGQVGRLCEQKGTDVFVRVAKSILEKDENYYFVLVGDGPYRENIEKYLKENNIADKFLITGWIDNPLEYNKLFDVSCLFSRWEGFGYVIEEYKRLGTPIVATNVGAIPELLKITYDLNNLADLETAITNSKEEKYSCDFSVEKCVKKHVEMIFAIMEVKK